LTVDLDEGLSCSDTSLLGNWLRLFRHLDITDYLILEDGNLLLRAGESEGRSLLKDICLNLIISFSQILKQLDKKGW